MILPLILPTLTRPTIYKILKRMIYPHNLHSRPFWAYKGCTYLVLNESGYKLVHPGVHKVYIFFLYTFCIPWHEVITSLFYQIRATTVFLTHPPLSRMKGKSFGFPLFYLYLLLLHLISSFDIILLLIL